MMLVAFGLFILCFFGLVIYVGLGSRRLQQERALGINFEDILIPEDLLVFGKAECIFGTWIDISSSKVGLDVRDSSNSKISLVSREMGSNKAFFKMENISYEITTLDTWKRCYVLKKVGGIEVLCSLEMGPLNHEFVFGNTTRLNSPALNSDRFRFWSPNSFAPIFNESERIGGVWRIGKNSLNLGRAMVLSGEAPMPVRVFIIYCGREQI